MLACKLCGAGNLCLRHAPPDMHGCRCGHWLHEKGITTWHPVSNQSNCRMAGHELKSETQFANTWCDMTMKDNERYRSYKVHMENKPYSNVAAPDCTQIRNPLMGDLKGRGMQEAMETFHKLQAVREPMIRVHVLFHASATEPEDLHSTIYSYQPCKWSKKYQASENDDHQPKLYDYAPYQDVVSETSTYRALDTPNMFAKVSALNELSL